MESMGGALQITGKEATQVFRSQVMQGFENHCFSFTIYKMLNGLPSKLLDKWPACGIKSAIGNDPCSTILKFLQLVKFH